MPKDYRSFLRWMVVVRTRDDKTIAPETVFDMIGGDSREEISFVKHESDNCYARQVEELRLDFNNLLTLCIIPVRKELW